MLQINWGQSDSQEFKGRNIRGFSFVAFLQHTTVNTAFAANPLDWSKVTGKAVYQKQSGPSHNIFNDVLLPLILETGFMNGGFQQNIQIGTFTAPVYVAAAAGVDEVLLLSAQILLHDILNVKGNEVLTLELQAPNGAVTATVDTTVSFLYYDILEGCGVGKSIPIIRTKSLRASISSEKTDMGDGVLAASFINTDKAGITSAVQVITNAQFESDKLSFSDDYYELVCKRYGQFVSRAEADIRNQCFRLFDMNQVNYSGMAVRLNGARFNFTFNQANVTASKNWVVWRAYVNDLETYAYAKEKYPEHARENAEAPLV